MSENTIPIPARLKNVSIGGHVAGAEDIIDDALNKEQSVVNQETNAALATHAGQIADLQAMEQIVIDGGEAQIAQGSDFDNPDATKRAKIPTVGAVLDGMDAVPTAGSVKPVQSGGMFYTLNKKIEQSDYIKYNYSLLESGDFGTSSTYKHGVVPVVAGETFAIENISDSSDNVRYAFAYSSASSSGGDIPLVPGTSVVVVPHQTTAYITIPEGCTFLLFNAYDVTKFYRILDTINADNSVSFDSDKAVSGKGVAEYVGLPSKYYEVSWDSVKLMIIDSIVLKKGHTYKATATRTSTNTCYLYICSGNSSDEGTIYITLSMGSGVTTATGSYTNNTDADITANIVVRGSNAIKGLHIDVTEQSNKVVWTAAQSLTSEEKAQVLTNLGIDLSHIVDSNTVRSRLSACYLQTLNFDNTNHKAVVGAMSYANQSASSGRSTVNATEKEYTFNQSSTTTYWFVYDTSDSSYKFISVGNSTIAQIIIASIQISGNGTTNGKVLDVTWCICENYQINGVGVETRLNTLENPDIVSRNIIRDAAVRAVGKKAVNTDILPMSFIHISDIHTKSGNYKCFENACEFCEHYSNIPLMIATGDLVYDTFADAMTYYDTALAKTTKPVLNVIGNHDAGQYKANLGLASVGTDKQVYDKYIAPYVDGWSVTQPADAATEGKSYYYKDYSTRKVRIIVLNEFETEYEISPTDETKLKYSREYRAMRQAQVTWLITTLTNTPSDYGVIIAMHQPLGSLANVDNPFVSFDMVGGYKFNVYSEDKEWLAKIINAYTTKTALTLTVTQTGAVVQNDATLNCNCDFTSVQSEFICVICGHVHRDYIGHLANYPAIKILAVGADNLAYTSSFQPREAGTPSEDLLNVVNIDRNRKTIKIIRIGSDASVTGQVRDQMIMSYATT